MSEAEQMTFRRPFNPALSVDVNTRERGDHPLSDTQMYMARSIGRLEIMMGELPGCVVAFRAVAYLNKNPKVMMDRQRRKLLDFLRTLKPYQKVQL